jgi:hypothetical protein
VTFDNSKSSERRRDEATVELLKKLRDKLLSNNISTARQAAFNLSWKQEDGLVILKEALFGNYPRTAKKAAAYGLRSMNGRMQKMALEVHEQGLKHLDRTTKAVCVKSLYLLKGGVLEKAGFGGRHPSGKLIIKEITKKNGMRQKSQRKKRIPIFEVFTPEPTTLLLLDLSAGMLRKRR